MACSPHAHGIPANPHPKKKPRITTSPNKHNPAKRNLKKQLTTGRKINEEKTTAETKKKSEPKLRASPMPVLTPKPLRIKAKAPATAPHNRTRRKTPQVSKVRSHRFAHRCTNLHRLLRGIQLTPQTTAIIFRTRLNRKA